MQRRAIPLTCSSKSRSPVIQCDRTPQEALVRGFFPTHHIDEVRRRHPEVRPHKGPGHMPPLLGPRERIPARAASGLIALERGLLAKEVPA